MSRLVRRQGKEIKRQPKAKCAEELDSSGIKGIAVHHFDDLRFWA